MSKKYKTNSGEFIEERCPNCQAQLLSDGEDKWCSLLGCDYSTFSKGKNESEQEEIQISDLITFPLQWDGEVCVVDAKGNVIADFSVVFGNDWDSAEIATVGKWAVDTLNAAPTQPAGATVTSNAICAECDGDFRACGHHPNCPKADSGYNETVEQARQFLIDAGFTGFADHSLTPKWMAEFASVLLAEAQKENNQLKSALDLFGIEILDNGSTRFSAAKMKKFRQSQRDEEFEVLQNQLEDAQREREQLKEAGARIINTQGEVFNLQFICCRCDRVSVWTNDTSGEYLECSVCGREHFAVKVIAASADESAGVENGK